MASRNEDVLICMVLWVAITSWIVCMASSQPQPTCLPKLLPCQPFLRNTSPPPGSCCIPLTDLMDNDPDCLCAIFSNKEILETFNVTKEDAFNLPKLCGRPADAGHCKTVSTSQSPSSPEPPHSTPTSASAPTGGYLQALLFGWIASMAVVATLL